MLFFCLISAARTSTDLCRPRLCAISDQDLPSALICMSFASSSADHFRYPGGGALRITQFTNRAAMRAVAKQTIARIAAIRRAVLNSPIAQLPEKWAALAKTVASVKRLKVWG